MRWNRRFSILAGLSLLAVVSLGNRCNERRYDPDAFSPTAPGVFDTLTLKPDKSSITADGSSTTVITATLSPVAAEGRRTVEFTTSTGTFVGAPTGTSTAMTVEATTVRDAQGVFRAEAKVTLKSSTKAETASIDAKVKEGTRTLVTAHTEVQFVTAGPTTIQLTASSASIPADGFSRTTLVATISADTPSDRRKVIFSATKGTLVNGSAGPPSTLEVIAGRDNTARADLVSSRTLETSIVTATLDGVAEAVDRVTIRFEAPGPSSLIQISTSISQAPADGATVVQVTATVPPELPQADRTVTFTTTAGTLLQATATADASNRAIVDLRADSRIVTAVLRATAGGSTAQTTLPFVRALPESIIVNPAASTIKADGTTQVAITADLRRDVGTVTEGTVVEFTAVDKDGKSLLFRDVKPSTTTTTTPARQVATANMIAPVGTTPGAVTIKATVKVGSTTIEGEETIVVTP